MEAVYAVEIRESKDDTWRFVLDVRGNVAEYTDPTPAQIVAELHQRMGYDAAVRTIRNGG